MQMRAAIYWPVCAWVSDFRSVREQLSGNTTMLQ